MHRYVKSLPHTMCLIESQLNGIITTFNNIMYKLLNFTLKTNRYISPDYYGLIYCNFFITCYVCFTRCRLTSDIALILYCIAVIMKYARYLKQTHGCVCHIH